MNIYDFDGTIYDGDSSIDFFKFCIKKNKKCVRVIPSLIGAGILYMLKLKEKEYVKTKFFAFIKYFDNIDKIIGEFWEKNECKIKKFYLKQKQSSDIVVSASPELLLKPVTDKLGVKLLGTQIDEKTGKIIGKNCHGSEKVKRLKKDGVTRCKKFYSDSFSDKPCSKLADYAFIVKGDLIYPWDEYKPRFVEKVIKTFLSRDFFTFGLIGVINVFNGVIIAYIYSLFIENEVFAYVLGFLTSLMISYILNSKLNFKKKLSFKRFLKFALSNIPNFLIQVFSVIVLLSILELPKIVSYIISAVVAVPLTFVLVKILVFKKATD